VEPALITSQNLAFRGIGGQDICSEILEIAKHDTVMEKDATSILAHQKFRFQKAKS
jgi:hypothetical protein